MYRFIIVNAVLSATLVTENTTIRAVWVLHVINAYYLLTKTTIMNELTLYEDKLAYIYRKRSLSILRYWVVYKPKLWT